MNAPKWILVFFPKSHLKSSEVLSSRPGRSSSAGGKRETAKPNWDYRHKTAESFTVREFKYLENARSTRGSSSW